MRRLILVLVASFATDGLAGAPEARHPSDTDRPNLILITLDTTRADYLGSHGFPLPTSPNLDRLAARGVRFANAISQIPLTGPSHATMLTGLHPHQHGAVRNGVPVAEDVPTVSERLQADGYRTAAFLSGWTLRANLSGLARGFDVYDDKMENRYRLVNSQRFAHQVTPLAIQWLEAHGSGPFFLWIHYFDPHAPYLKRKGLYEALEGEGGATAGDLPDRNLRYASEIHHTDAWVGRLLETVERLGIEEKTIVVLTADHGEALGEHGYVGHGRRVYEEILHVPLIVSWPGRLPEGLRVDVPVALLDLAPTILGLLDLPRLGEGMDLGPLLSGGGATESFAKRRILFETYPGARKRFWRLFASRVKLVPTLVGFREGDLKFVYNTKREAGELFDLSSTAGEAENLIDRYPGYGSSGIRLVRWIELSAREPVETTVLDAEDREQLRSLGYAQ